MSNLTNLNLTAFIGDDEVSLLNDAVGVTFVRLSNNDSDDGEGAVLRDYKAELTNAEPDVLEKVIDAFKAFKFRFDYLKSYELAVTGAGELDGTYVVGASS